MMVNLHLRKLVVKQVNGVNRHEGIAQDATIAQTISIRQRLLVRTGSGKNVKRKMNAPRIIILVDLEN